MWKPGSSTIRTSTRPCFTASSRALGLIARTRRWSGSCGGWSCGRCAWSASTDAAWPGTPATDVEVTTRWPPYALADGSPLRDALLTGAARAGLAPVAKVAGPSNIGNYLAGLGIPATAGFGVDYKGLHGTDERVRLDSIPAVQATYHQALLILLHGT